MYSSCEQAHEKTTISMLHLSCKLCNLTIRAPCKEETRTLQVKFTACFNQRPHPSCKNNFHASYATWPCELHARKKTKTLQRTHSVRTHYHHTHSSLDIRRPLTMQRTNITDLTSLSSKQAHGLDIPMCTLTVRTHSSKLMAPLVAFMTLIWS